MPPKYNVAIIAGQLVVGGAERQLYLWLSHLDRDKFKPVVLTLHPGCGDYWENPIESLDIPLLRIPHRRSRLTRLFDIVRVLHPYKPQLIHGWHLFASPYAGAAAKMLSAKSLGSLRGSYKTFCSSSQASISTFHLVDAILANSFSAGERLSKLRKRKRQSIYVVQNAVEDKVDDRLNMREKLSQRFGISPDSMWIGSLGRLDPQKRFDLLLKAIALLKEDVKDFHFLLIGDGPDRLHLANIAEALGIADYVTFAGEVPSGSAWLSALDIFCFMSLDEGLPNVVMEAAIARLPTVSWCVPFMEELMNDGKTAFLVEPENLIAFKETLLNLIHSPELRVKMGEAGRNHMLENFTLDRFVQRMTNVYNDLLSTQQASNEGES